MPQADEEAVHDHILMTNDKIDEPDNIHDLYLLMKDMHESMKRDEKPDKPD